MRRRSPLLAVAALSLSATVAFAMGQTHWMGTVAGTDGAKTTGSAMMMTGKAAGTTEVTVELKGETPSVTRPWHVHVGSCTKAGAPFGGARNYTPIAIDDKGNGKSVVTLPVALPDSGSYYVNIHESAANMGKIVACGDLAKM